MFDFGVRQIAHGCQIPGYYGFYTRLTFSDGTRIYGGQRSYGKSKAWRWYRQNGKKLTAKED